VVDKMVAQGVFVGITIAGPTRNKLLPDESMSASEHQRVLENMHKGSPTGRAMKAAGAKMMVSTDAGCLITAFKDIHLSLQEYSMVMDVSALETVRAVTQTPAEALGLADEIGTVEVGKKADLLVLNADPLEDLGNIADVHLVIKEGKLVVSEGRLIL